MAGYIGSKTSVTQVDGYNRTEADDEFVNDPNSVISVSGGNVGIGVIPSAWNSAFDAVQVGRSVALWSQNNYDKMWLTTNTYLDTAGNFKYISSAPVTTYNQTDGTHQWSYAASGTAGNTVTLTEAARIDSGGRLLLNTGGAYTYPNNVFEVSAGPNQYAAHFSKSDTTDQVVTIFRHAGATGGTNRAALYFMSGSGSEVGKILINGTSTSYATTSDYRLKTDAQPLTGASARVQALNPVNFEWKDGGHRVDGFLAHEAQEIVPEAVSGTKDAMRDEEYEVTPAILDDDGNVVTEAVMGTRSVPDYQGIDQSKLVPLLTAALQEALTEIADLKARVTALEAV